MKQNLKTGEKRRTALRIKSVIFDYDGVIMDSFSHSAAIYSKIFRSKGIDFSESEFKFSNSTDWRRYFRGKGFPQEEMDRLPEIFFAHYKKIKDKYRVFSGVPSLLKKLKKNGLSLGIVSNGDRRIIEEQLANNRILGHFGAIIGLEAKMHKPDPWQILQCAKILGVKPNEVCAVGDTADDIRAARNADVGRVIAVTYGYHHESMLDGADFYAETPEQIFDMVIS